MEINKHIQNRKGITIIACTNHPRFINNIFNNYKNQIFKNKELIIILNRDDLVLDEYRRKGENYNNVSVFKLPEKTSLGSCLNFAVKKAKYDCVAKFDHDDYYAPYYVKRSMNILNRSNIDVVGKRAVYLYLESRKTLYIRFPKMEHKFVRNVAGGTIMFKKKIFNHVKFPNQSLGEDVIFLERCAAKGYKTYSGDKYNYVYIRRKNSSNHTWKKNDKSLIRNCIIVGRTSIYKKIANRF